MLLPSQRNLRDTTQVGGLGPLAKPLAIALAGLIASAVVARFGRQSLDYPGILFLNRYADRSVLFDGLMVALTRLALLKGVVIMAGIWLVWFDAPAAETRARIAAGLIAASMGGLLSRGLQFLLPTHPRPIHDPALHFVRPYGVDPTELTQWNAFPSDHGSLLFGIAMTIAIVRPRLGAAAFAWALIITLSRVYAGLHFLSDVTGAAGLGVAMVCISQLYALRRCCLVLARWAVERPGIFYAAAFVVTYQFATLFDDVRAIGSGLAGLLH